MYIAHGKKIKIRKFVTRITAERCSVKANGFFWTIDLNKNKRQRHVTPEATTYFVPDVKQPDMIRFHTPSMYAMIEPKHGGKKAGFPTVVLLGL